MEVHHHAHSATDDHRGKRKNWTHYFWEFIMLFLAVFCGFLAEYQLEHKIEKEKGKKYIRSMYEDLKIDRSTFTDLLAVYNEKITNLQSYRSCYEAISKESGNDDCFKNIFYYANSFPDMITADRTLQQLKSSGGLRLLKDDDADSIILYDAELRKSLQSERTDFQEVQTMVRNSSYDVLNFRGIHNTYMLGDTTQTIPMLAENKKEQLNKLFLVLTRYLLVMYARRESISHLKKKAEDLLYYFQQKYHFK